MLLDDILPHEMALRRLKKLPTEAAPPQLTSRVVKTLGTCDADALRLESTSVFNVSNLLVKAHRQLAQRARRRKRYTMRSSKWTQPSKSTVRRRGIR